MRVSPNLGPDEALTDIATAARILGRGERIDRLRILPDQPLGRPPLAEVAPGLTRVQPEDEADIAQLTESFHLNLTVFGLLSFAVGLFIVHASVGLAFEQRRGVVPHAARHRRAARPARGAPRGRGADPGARRGADRRRRSATSWPRS